MPTLITRLLLLLSFTTLLLQGSVNPFIVLNQEHISEHQVYIPLPIEQTIQCSPKRNGYHPLLPTEDAWITIAPFQKLILLLKEKTPITLTAELTEDGRLFEQTSPTLHISQKTAKHYYVIENPHPWMLGVKLSTTHPTDLLFMTTYDPDLLAKQQPISLKLPKGEKQSIFLRKKGITSTYHRFKDPTTSTFSLQGPGTLELKMAASVTANTLLSPHRQRITITHDQEENKILEALNTLSPDRLQDHNDTAVTTRTSHFLPLHKGENHITIKTYSDILLQANLYKKNLFYKKNETRLRWKSTDSLDFINQPKWRNSHKDEGVKRRETLLWQTNTIVNSQQKSSLLKSANKSTLMKPLYPSHIPLGASIMHANYGIYRLYLPETLSLLNALPHSYTLPFLHTMKRGFFLPVPKKEAKSVLKYTFKSSLKRPTELLLTANLNQALEAGFILQSDHGVKRHFLLHFQNPFIHYSFSKAKRAYTLLKGKTNPDQTLATLKDAPLLPHLSHVGNMHITLPKKTKSIHLIRTQKSPAVQLSLQIREGSTYKDTPYALSHTYANSYKQFLQSLYTPIPKAFLAWYEHTHPLRLWFLSRITMAKQQVNPGEIPKNLNYARSLAQRGDHFTSSQIAKHALLLTHNASLRKEAYHLLLKLSKERDEKLLYHILYAVKSGSPESLYKVADALQEQGKTALALTLRLLLERSATNNNKSARLAVRQHNLPLATYLAPHNNHASLKARRKTLSQTLHTPNAIMVKKCAGIVQLYTPVQHQYLSGYKATEQQPLQIEIEGPLSLEFSVRLFNASQKYHWMKITHNGTPYHYPLTQTKRSHILKYAPSNKPIGLTNTLSLTLGEGRHTLLLHGYNQPLAIGLQGYTPSQSIYPPLDTQILKTKNNSPKVVQNRQADATIAYLSALLWNQTYGTQAQYEEAQAKAWVLKGEQSYSGVTASLLKLLTRFSHFKPLKTLQTPLGFYDMPVPVWQPLSPLQKNRTPLIDGIQDHHKIITGEKQHIIHMQGEKNTTLVFKHLFPRYLPTEALCFALYFDGKLEKMVKLDSNKTTHYEHLLLSRGDHAVTVQLSSPLSTHYLGLTLYEDGKRVIQQKEKRYYHTTHQTPLTLHTKGPTLLRVEERTQTSRPQIRYLYLPLNRVYTQAFPPTLFSEESLVTIAQMQFDPSAKLLREFERHYRLPTLLQERDFMPEPYKTSPLLPSYPTVAPPTQSFIPTGTITLASLGQKKGDEDEREADIVQRYSTELHLRSRLSRDTYLSQHYFVQYYTAPLYGLFDHTLYSKLPMADLFGTLNLSGYFQKSNDFWFKNLQIKTEIFKKSSLSERWKQRYAVGGHRYFLDFDNPGEESLSPLVYSRYKKDHRYGAYLNYNLTYMPYDDVIYSVEVEVNSNEQLHIIDHLDFKLDTRQLYYPFDFKLFYDLRYYFEDRDRPHSYRMSYLGGILKFNRFFDNNRVELFAGVRYNIEKSQTALSFQLKWHFGKNHLFENFMPSEKSFNALKLRLNDKEAYAD